MSACAAPTQVQCAGCGKSAPAEPGRIPPGWTHYCDVPKCRGCQLRPSPELRAKERAARARDRRRKA